MRSLRDATTRAEILDRIDRLTSHSQRRWGKMDISQLLPHLSDLLRITLGEIETAPPSGPMRFAPVRYLMLYVLPWPKGKAEGPPEVFTTAPDSWEHDRTALLDLIDRYANAAADDLAPTNPVFGRMAAKDWDALNYRHLDHHLTQFGA